jgi:hypothetical protein
VGLHGLRRQQLQLRLRQRKSAGSGRSSR